MKHRVQHSLDVHSVRRLLEPRLAALTVRHAKYRPYVRWVDARRAVFGFEAKGRRVTGELHLLPRAVEIHARVPWAFRVFARPALAVVDAELRQLLAEAQDRRAFAQSC